MYISDKIFIRETKQEFEQMHKLSTLLDAYQHFGISPQTTL
jgi:hypothetical protein